MDFSTISDQIKETKNRIKNLKIPNETAKEIVVKVQAEQNVLTNAPLDRDSFEELLTNYEKVSVEKLEIGNFVRYKFKDENGNVKYVKGGVLIFKSPDYLRLKNVINKKSWSVYFSNPSRKYVFYQKHKQKLDEDGVYVNLNTASTEGLLAAIIDREGSLEALEKAAKIARKNYVKNRL